MTRTTRRPSAVALWITVLSALVFTVPAGAVTPAASGFAFPYSYGTPTVPAGIGAQGAQGPTVLNSTIGLNGNSVGAYGSVGGRQGIWPFSEATAALDIRSMNGTALSSVPSKYVSVEVVNVTNGSSVALTTNAYGWANTTVSEGYWFLAIADHAGTFINFTDQLNVRAATAATFYLLPSADTTAAVNNGASASRGTVNVNLYGVELGPVSGGLSVQLLNASNGNALLATAVTTATMTASFTGVSSSYSYVVKAIGYNQTLSKVRYFLHNASTSPFSPSTNPYTVTGANNFPGSLVTGTTVLSSGTITGSALQTGGWAWNITQSTAVSNARLTLSTVVYSSGGNQWLNFTNSVVVWNTTQSPFSYNLQVSASNTTFILLAQQSWFLSQAIYFNLENCTVIGSYGTTAPGLIDPSGETLWTLPGIQEYSSSTAKIAHSLLVNPTIVLSSSNRPATLNYSGGNPVLVSNSTILGGSASGTELELGFSVVNSLIRNTTDFSVFSTGVARFTGSQIDNSSFVLHGFGSAAVGSLFVNYTEFGPDLVSTFSQSTTTGYVGFYHDAFTGPNLAYAKNNLTYIASVVGETVLQIGTHGTLGYDSFNFSALLFNLGMTLNGGGPTTPLVVTNSIFGYAPACANLLCLSWYASHLSPAADYSFPAILNVESYGYLNLSYDVLGVDVYVNQVVNGYLTVGHDLITPGWGDNDLNMGAGSSSVPQIMVDNNTVTGQFVNLTAVMTINTLNGLYDGCGGPSAGYDCAGLTPINGVTCGTPCFHASWVTATHNTLRNILGGAGGTDFFGTFANVTYNLVTNNQAYGYGSTFVTAGRLMMLASPSGWTVHVSNNWFVNVNNGTTVFMVGQGGMPIQGNIAFQNNHVYYAPPIGHNGPYYVNAYTNSSWTYVPLSRNFTPAPNNVVHGIGFRNWWPGYGGSLVNSSHITFSGGSYVSNSTFAPQTGNSEGNIYLYNVTPDVNVSSGVPIIAYSTGLVAGPQPNFLWGGASGHAFNYSESIEPSYVAIGVNSTHAPPVDVVLSNPSVGPYGVAELTESYAVNGTPISSAEVSVGANGTVTAIYNPATMPGAVIFSLTIYTPPLTDLVIPLVLILAVVGGVAVGLSGAIFGVTSRRRSKRAEAAARVALARSAHRVRPRGRRR